MYRYLHVRGQQRLVPRVGEAESVSAPTLSEKNVNSTEQELLLSHVVGDVSRGLAMSSVQ